ncbi:hypothetical protein HMPREF3091_20900 [Hafnia sp. HMSC23F03]|nr:hypothetical protein HMPREF3091_20900 [Hafnia sp. HMSC23F03]
MTGMSCWRLGRPGWAIPNRSEDGISDKSARVQRPRAGGLCPYAFMDVSMKLGMDRRAEYYTQCINDARYEQAGGILH